MGRSLKKNDRVMVITGKEKGKEGRVLSVLPKKNRVIVEKLNLVKRHMKPSRQYRQGGIIEKEGTLHVSNVMLVCTRCQKPTTIGNKILDDGRKVRFCKKCQEVVDQ